MAEVDTVLPLLRGDPAAVQELASRLRLVAGRSAETVLARQAAGGLDLNGLWAGPAFEAARTELSSAGAALAQLRARLLPAAAALDGYADALVTAVALVAALREEWHAADRALEAAAAPALPAGTDPTSLAILQSAGASRERTRLSLLDRYARCVRALEAAEEHAAAALLAVLGDAGTPARQRDLLLGALPLTRAAATRAEAQLLVDRALDGYDADARNWTVAQVQHLLGAVAGSAGDPLVARVLLDRIGVAGLEHLVELLGPGGAGPAPAPVRWTDGARRTLALAFATSVSDTAAADPVTASSLGQWRAGWVDTLVGRPVEGLTAQVALLAVAARGPVPVLPDHRYAVGALRALVRSEVLQPRRLVWQPGGRDGFPVLAPASDVVGLLVSTLAREPVQARRVLLSPGVAGPSLVHDLVASLPFADTAKQGRVPSMEALGRLLEQLAVRSEDSSPDQARLRTAVLDGLGEAGRRWWGLEGKEGVTVDQRLEPLRRPAALLLAGDPGRVWDAIGTFGVRNDGGSAGARMQALLGEIGKAPEVGPLVAALAAFEADRLSVQLSAGRAVHEAPVQAAALRLGYVVGFTGASAAASLVRAGAQHDAVSARERQALGSAMNVAQLLPVKYAGPAGAVAAAVLAPANLLATRIVDSANPVHHAANAATDGAGVLAAGRELAIESASKAALERLGTDEAAVTVMSSAAATSVANAADSVASSVALLSRPAPAPPRVP